MVVTMEKPGLVSVMKHPMGYEVVARLMLGVYCMCLPISPLVLLDM
jgi:hypothetical protein